MSKTVYAAMYSDCTYESALSPISLHESFGGAAAALEKHKAERKADHADVYRDDEDPPKWSDEKGTFAEHWEVVAFEVKP
jgi:hypothetical protein